MTGAGQDSYHCIRALALHSPPAGRPPAARQSPAGCSVLRLCILDDGSTNPSLVSSPVNRTTDQPSQPAQVVLTLHPSIAHIFSHESRSALVPATGIQCPPPDKQPNDSRMLRSPN
jgi:hypothetical protein